MKKSDDYKQSTDDEIATAAERVLGKLRQVNSEYLSWFEIVLAMVFAIIGYNLPVWLLFFQKKMRKMEMENEVMQFQTIILMLMRIERVNVEMILEGLKDIQTYLESQLQSVLITTRVVHGKHLKK